jgi:hypothetical protein
VRKQDEGFGKKKRNQKEQSCVIVGFGILMFTFPGEQGKGGRETEKREIRGKIHHVRNASGVISSE